jgi:hypothetical protein
MFFIIVLFGFMFACMAALYLTFFILMVVAAIAKFEEMIEGKPDEPGGLTVSSATAKTAH